MSEEHGYPLLTRPEVLRECYLPPELHGRSEHCNEIAACVRPLAQGRRPIHCWLYGPPGSGKTVAARWALHKLGEEHGIRHIFINCWENPTFFSVLDRISRECRILGADKLSTSFKLERIKKHLRQERMVIVLDEIDQAPPKDRNAILYNFGTMPEVGLLCMCNSETVYFGLQDRVKSRLNPRRLHFPGYEADQLLRILQSRAELAAEPDVLTQGVVYTISRLASGDARLAIKTLRDASYWAVETGQSTVRERHVWQVWNRAKELNIEYHLGQLTDHHRLLYGLVRERPGILSGDLWRLYKRTCLSKRIQPIASRTYSDYCNKLVHMGLVKAKRAAIQGKVREFSAAE